MPAQVVGYDAIKSDGTTSSQLPPDIQFTSGGVRGPPLPDILPFLLWLWTYQAKTQKQTCTGQQSDEGIGEKLAAMQLVLEVYCSCCEYPQSSSTPRMMVLQS